MLIKLFLILVKIFIPIITRLEIHGDPKLLNQDKHIFVANHIGVLEGILVYYFIDRDDIILLLAEKHKRSRIVRWFAGQMNAIFVDRYNADVNALRIVLKRLEAGGVMVVAPEGTRSPDGCLQEGRLGAGYLASKTGVPVLPVAVVGTEDAVVKSRLRRLQRVPVTIWIGESFTLPKYRIQERREKLKVYTDEIMCHIAALLPPERRGFYANFPRTLELLASQPNPID